MVRQPESPEGRGRTTDYPNELKAWGNGRGKSNLSII